MKTKICKKCNEEKDVELFGKDKKGKLGLKSWCKECEKERCKNWRLNNPEKFKEIQKNYRLNNPEKVKEMTKNWYLNNPEKFKEKQKNYLLNNTEKNKENCKNWYLNNIEKIKESNKKVVNELRKGYLIKRLKGKGFKKEQITPELLELQKIIIKTIRLCKTSQN